MFLYSLPLKSGHLNMARKHLASKFPRIKRSHLAEALASSLGFNTSIALQTSLREMSEHELRYERFEAQAFITRLLGLGYSFEEHERSVFMDIDFPTSMALDFFITANGTVLSTRAVDAEAMLQSGTPTRAMVDTCKRILGEIGMFRKTPESLDSYQAKNRIEEALGVYITNGAVIQANAELNLPMQTLDGPNVGLYFDEAALQEAIERAGAYSMQCMWGS